MANYNIVVDDQNPSAAIAINSERVRIAATTDVFFAVGDETVAATDQDLIVTKYNVEENVIIGGGKYVSARAVSGTGVVSVTELQSDGTGGFYTPPGND
jgi:hypothetical protein